MQVARCAVCLSNFKGIESDIANNLTKMPARSLTIGKFELAYSNSGQNTRATMGGPNPRQSAIQYRECLHDNGQHPVSELL